MKVTAELLQEWKSVVEHPNVPAIEDAHKRAITVQMLENTRNALHAQSEALTEASAAPTNVTGNVGKYDPVLISLVRRAMPNLMAYDVCGVQPMTGPTGLIFALRPKYVPNPADFAGSATDAFYNEADSDYSGTGTHAGNDPAVLNDPTPGAYTSGTGMDVADGEVLGTEGNTAFNEMGFEIEKVSVEAKSRKLKAQYSVEFSQDLKAIHGLDAEAELANILSAEILAEINREVIRTIYVTAKKGAQNGDLTNAGRFDLDLDSNGRWSVEKFKGLLFQIERDANAIAKETRRGKGNFIICSSDVASALTMAGMLDYTPALSTNLQVDDTGNTFAGVLNGRYRVYVDPYATGNFYVVGYKGANAYDAGLYYAPYQPLMLHKAISEDSFQPKIGFSTRYGLVANPFAEGTTKGAGALTANANVYFRRVKVENLTGAAS